MIGVRQAFVFEIKRIFRVKPAFTVLVVAVLVYAVFYPAPYLHESLRDVPIAIVDQDGTPSSREIARYVDASADISIQQQFPDLRSAEQAIFARKIFGVLVIPQYFERDLLRGRPSALALYGDASYFLIYQSVSNAVTSVARSYGVESEAGRLIATGIDPVVASAVVDPMRLTTVPLFNPQNGYATYVLPAALLLVLQQTLLIGVGQLETASLSASERASRPGPLASIAGKVLALVVFYIPAFAFYTLVLPYIYQYPRLGAPVTILTVSVLYIVTVVSLAICLARILKEPLTLQLTMAAVGLPFFFTSGFSWPSEMIPPPVSWFAELVPSTSAIQALVRIAQMGAQPWDVKDCILRLGVLAAVYFSAAVWLEARSRPRPERTAAKRHDTIEPEASQT